jgi:hypothetical protein
MSRSKLAQRLSDLAISTMAQHRLKNGGNGLEDGWYWCSCGYEGSYAKGEPEGGAHFIGAHEWHVADEIGLAVAKSVDQETVEEVLEAQADLQTALGLFRLDHGRRDTADDPHDAQIEERLNKSLARLHKLLDALGRPMYQPATHPEIDDPWVCEKCGQLLAGPAALCNSGIHVGPGDGEEAQGEAVRLSESRFDEATILPHRHD